MNELNLGTWTADWMWSLPLIVLTVLIHTFSLVLLHGRITRTLSRAGKNHVSRFVPMLVMGATALAVTVLHGFEGAIWAVAYRVLGALQDNKSAMLYSLSAITAYGHEHLSLAPHWRMMGALEALNGLILFGVTTAFMFTVIQKVWPDVMRG